MPDVVDRDVADEVDRAGLGVDLDDGDCAPAGQPKFSRVVDGGLSSPGSIPSGRLCAVQAANAAAFVLMDRSVPATVNVPFS